MFWQVVVFPLPVTPDTNICLSKLSLSRYIGLVLSTFPLWTKSPRRILFSSAISTWWLSPNSTSSLKAKPTTSFWGSPAIIASSLVVIQFPITNDLSFFIYCESADLETFSCSPFFLLFILPHGSWKHFNDLNISLFLSTENALNGTLLPVSPL